MSRYYILRDQMLQTLLDDLLALLPSGQWQVSMPSLTRRQLMGRTLKRSCTVSDTRQKGFRLAKIRLCLRSFLNVSWELWLNDPRPAKARKDFASLSSVLFVRFFSTLRGPLPDHLTPRVL